MPLYSRRDFLKALAASAGFLAADRTVAFGQSQAPLNFLVVGDSLVWGQGLLEKDKFYALTAEWLRNGAFGRPRPVDLKVKAHSGSNLKFNPQTAEKFRKAGRDEALSLHPEVNVGFPSTWKQLEVARAEYRQEGKTRGADLIMLTGGITDISIDKILDPFGDDKVLPPLIEKYCRDDMFDVLQHAVAMHPNASFVVAGYYAMISPKTPSSKLLNSWLEALSFPDALKPIANNPVTRRLFFSRLRKKALQRSRIWFQESNRNLQMAVNKFNVNFPETRAVFVRSPITEDTTYETTNALVFGMGKDGEPQDPMAARRADACRSMLPALEKSTDVQHSVKRCEIAGIGHPNPAGAHAYFDEIRNALANDVSIIRRLAFAR